MFALFRYASDGVLRVSVKIKKLRKVSIIS